jgi:2-polyprenyl-3-methyl-5-hydroxy-6-metoxy-1,4-benzoquinol methylase
MSEQFPTIEDYYDALAESYSENIAESPTRSLLDWPAVRPLLPDVAGERVLDAGCGPGTYAGWLAERGADVVGVDVSSRMVEIAEREFGEAATFRGPTFKNPSTLAPTGDST